MKAATLRAFLTVHTWTGLIAGMALFIAFYAGAFTVFQAATAQWQRPELRESPATTPQQLESLLEEVTRTHPRAKENLWVYLPSPFAPRMFLFWREKKPEAEHLFAFGRDGRAHEISEESKLSDLINQVHYSLGLPERWGTWLMGIVSILYGLALVSGVLVHLPTLVQDLFALRRGRNLKRMWQDAHNVIGVLSLPFHIVFAFTGTLLCVLVLFVAGLNFIGLGGKGAALYQQARYAPEMTKQDAGATMLPPATLLAAARDRAPTLQPHFMNYRSYGDAAATVSIAGPVPGHLSDLGIVTLEARSGKVVGVQLPGERGNAHAAVRGVTSIHYGTFGGLPVQWLYFLLGLAGAFLFYSGNLLWIESRRKRRQIEQPRVHRFLARLTVGVCLGCCAALSATFVASLLLQNAGGEWRTYYAVFLGSVLWAQLRPPARAAIELALLAGVLSLAVPVTNAIVTADHLFRTAMTGQWQVFGVDAVAIALGLGFLRIAQVTWRRARNGDPHSVWSLAPPAGTAQPAE